MELVLDHVTKRFRDKTAAEDICLKLTPGVWGLLGANGAGKTTLMRIIAGILPPTSGDVLYGGVPIGKLGEQYRNIFGYLPQEFGYDREFTVEDYLTYTAALKGLPEQQDPRAAGAGFPVGRPEEKNREALRRNAAAGGDCPGASE